MEKFKNKKEIIDFLKGQLIKANKISSFITNSNIPHFSFGLKTELGFLYLTTDKMFQHTLTLEGITENIVIEQLEYVELRKLYEKYLYSVTRNEIINSTTTFNKTKLTLGQKLKECWRILTN